MDCFVGPTRRIESCAFLSSYQNCSTSTFCKQLLVIIAELFWASALQSLLIGHCGCRVPLDTAELMAMEFGHIPVVDKTSRGEHDADCVPFCSWRKASVVGLLLLATSFIHVQGCCCCKLPLVKGSTTLAIQLTPPLTCYPSDNVVPSAEPDLCLLLKCLVVIACRASAA